MALPPPGSTIGKAIPVGSVRSRWTKPVAIPSCRKKSRNASPKSSQPTQPTIATSPPRRRSAVAWFAPLPPRLRVTLSASTVSPRPGRRATLTQKSTMQLPTTTKDGGQGLPLALVLISAALGSAANCSPGHAAEHALSGGRAPSAPSAPPAPAASCVLAFRRAPRRTALDGSCRRHSGRPPRRGDSR